MPSDDEPNNYQIVHAPTMEQLVVSVRIEMLRDWVPQGGVAIDEAGFYQAMVPRGD